MKRPLILLVALEAALLVGRGTAQGRPATAWRDFAPDGAWCWFADPRAVRRDTTTFAGWVDSRGAVTVGALDPATGQVATHVLHPRLQADDHANPALLIRPDGRLLAFYSRHGGAEMLLRVSSRPADISEWEPERTLALHADTRTRKSVTYPNPVLLRDEGNAIYLFWRGDDWKPNLSISRDGGDTWSPARTVVTRPDAGRNNRPYVKVASNGRDRIHLAFTDGHPRNEPTNSVYYACYRDGAFRRADSVVIVGMPALPFSPERADRVYDATATGARAWIWDVAADGEGNPVIAYSRHPEETDHRYHYARWDGMRWVDHEMLAAGRWFPRTPAGRREPEPHYSGGLVLDHDDPRVVYLSRPVDGVFEIERWTTEDGGATWSRAPLTRDSWHDNVRPVAVRGHGLHHPRVLWMHNEGGYIHYTRFAATIKMDLPADRWSGAIEPSAVLAVMEKVADWQIAHPSRHALTDWTQGALFAGLMALAGITRNPRYEEHLMEVGEATGWQPGPRVYHADDHCVGQTWLDLYRRHGKPEMLEPLRRRFDHILANPTNDVLAWYTRHVTDKWSWCDALFMAPPAWARLAAVTGDRRYLDFMNRRWWLTASYLYDAAEHLWYRDSRYFERHEANGLKVFWSRGNGWVLGGLVRVLRFLPEDHPDRWRYVRQFREMSARVAGLAGRDGLWRASLLDPESFPAPETSGSGFFTYALAWGLNRGMLDPAAFAPVVRRAWKGLVAAVGPDGKLGWVQPIGADPRRIRKSDTEIYGVGAFLLAGSEVFRLAGGGGTPR